MAGVEIPPAATDFWEPKIKSPDAATVGPRLPVILSDFWDAIQQPTSTVPLVGTYALDFWDPIPVEASALRPNLDWSEGIALPRYEARAFENPFQFHETPPTLERIARRRAHWLCSLLDLPTTRERRWFAHRFEELFEHFPHVNTFRVLTELAIDGVSANEILIGFELRQVWADQPIFWSIRRKGNRGPFVPDAGERRLVGAGLSVSPIWQEDYPQSE